MREEIEIWKPVFGAPQYQVSSLGRVRSLDRILKDGRFWRGRILRQHLNNKGYYTTSIKYESGKRKRLVHSLVMESFKGHTPCRFNHVDHINNKKTDNRLMNLQVLSARDNTIKSRGQGSSIYTGVYWNKAAKKWHSQIIINGSSTYLGIYACELAAAKAYQDKLKELSKKD